MSAPDYTPDDAQREANDQAVRDAVALIYRPLTGNSSGKPTGSRRGPSVF